MAPMMASSGPRWCMMSDAVGTHEGKQEIESVIQMRQLGHDSVPHGVHVAYRKVANLLS